MTVRVGQTPAAQFENRDDVREYYVHPAHQALTEFSFPNSELIVTVDYETPAK